MTHLRCWAVVCSTLFIVAGTVARLAAADSDLTAANRVSRIAESKLLAGLHKPIQAEWSDVPLLQVLQSLATTAGVNLWIDREGLTAAGFSLEESLVNLHLGEVTVWQSLHFLLKPQGLSWHGADGVLSITTQEHAEEIHVTRTYDVQAIVTALRPQLKNRPRQPFSGLFSGASGGFCGSKDVASHRGGGGGLFRIPEQAESDGTSQFVLPQFGGGGPQGGFDGGVQPEVGILIGGRNQTATGEEVLSELLVTLSGGKWANVDGEGGTISVGHGRLIVRQAYHVHFQIRELLHAVEEFVVRGSKAKSVLIARPGYPHDEDAAILKRLAEPIDFDINDVPIDTKLAQLAKEGNFRLWFDKESLVAAGFDSAIPCSLKLASATLASVLDKLLSPLALTSVVEEGTLVITTAEKADEWSSTRISFTDDIPEAHAPAELLTAIQEATSGRWELVDGEGGRMWKAVPGWLVVKQTQTVHREIAQMLDDLRQAAPAPIEAAAAEIELRLYSVADSTAVDDLVRELPKLAANWDAERGSLVVLGQSLAIKQPATVHEHLADIFSALDRSHAKLNPPAPKETPKPATPAK